MKVVSTMAHEDFEWRSDEAEMVSALLGAFEQIGAERKGLRSISISPRRLFSRKSETPSRIGDTSSSMPVFMDEEDLETFPFLRRDTSASLEAKPGTSPVSPRFWWRRLVGPKAGRPVTS